MHELKVIGNDLASYVNQVCFMSKDGELVYNEAMSPNKFKKLLAKTKQSICIFCSNVNTYSRHFSRLL
jgi:hypothetical protein